MNAPISRREFLQASGALVVSVLVPFEESIAKGVSAARQNLVPNELDSWIAVLPSGRVQAFFGKMDMGQSLEPAIAQIVADELDVPFERVDVLMGDTGTSCNQGGASGSTGISQGARPLRNAAAEARRLLIQEASKRLGVPEAELAVAEESEEQKTKRKR